MRVRIAAIVACMFKHRRTETETCESVTACQGPAPYLRLGETLQLTTEVYADRRRSIYA